MQGPMGGLGMGTPVCTVSAFWWIGEIASLIGHISSIGKVTSPKVSVAIFH